MTDTTFSVTSQATPDDSVVAAAQLAPELGGTSTSPDLTWTGAPEGTRSFAVTCYDPDAPTGSGFWHWIAWDIPASATSLDLGVPRESTGLKQAANDFGRIGYDGPNPPAGPPHRYVFSVHALPVETLGADPSDPHVGARFAIFTQQLASADLTATYQVSE
ncbi:YbhB/YbcL family Raf kinase inhibitor-like protein [Brachybacterium halotolerans subsp. kimchii]|uniref:YbhB/YbcL family Raf kinase inhibitor-like protein n=1 Tax=Brachybacterium halotolerans TaxID=2795215 RepID=UPI001E659C9C|nr:YbhB/YbcL family Raf kinase inhibitor-like protein [Brachybacterium halotolerans]UEJ83537.1 YbhB/YbcL family Raf kinase inhibitor-like protein [Brachybacterium halotolerans subsp. kimchii]